MSLSSAVVYFNKDEYLYYDWIASTRSKAPCFRTYPPKIIQGAAEQIKRFGGVNTRAVLGVV
jgi:hypothetical protein